MKAAVLLEFLRGNGLSVAEFHVLQAIHYGPQPSERLVRMATAESESWQGRLPCASRLECDQALASLLSKGLLQVVDGSVIIRIEAEIAADFSYTLMGPPNPGEIDFTPEGGRLWQRLGSEAFDSGGPACCGYGEFNEETCTFRSEYLGATEQIVRDSVAKDLDGNASEILAIEGPDPIGPWRDFWWDVVHQQGYRMVVIERPASETEQPPDRE